MQQMQTRVRSEILRIGICSACDAQILQRDFADDCDTAIKSKGYRQVDRTRSFSPHENATTLDACSCGMLAVGSFVGITVFVAVIVSCASCRHARLGRVRMVTAAPGNRVRQHDNRQQ